MTVAARDLARVRDARPDVAELARAVSIAAQVDVGVVRRVRLRLLPGADVSTETALWTSNLVQGRGERQLELRDDVRAELWRELGEHRVPLDRARAALAEVRVTARPLLRLEEELIYRGIVGDLERIDAELRAVIVAMRDAPERRRNLAAWAARVLELVPPLARQTEAARILGSVASAWVATSEEIARLQPDIDSLPIVHLLQPDATRVAFHVERIGDELVVGTAARKGPHVTIDEVLASNPVLVIDQNRTVRLDLKEDTRIPVQGARVRLGTLDQRQWWLEPAQARPPTKWIVPIPSAGTGACVMYLVSATHAVSCARISTTPQSFSIGRELHAARVVAVDEDADIALVELSPRSESTPYDLKLDVDQGQAWQAFAPSGTRVVGTVATAWPGVTLRLPEGTTETLLPGTPIFVGDKVIGHVRAVPPTADGHLHTTSARLIRWWVDQASQPAPAEDTPQPAGVAGESESPSIWLVRQRQSTVEPIAPFDPSGRMGEGDLVLLVAQIDTGPEVWRPAAIYRWVRRTAQAAQGTRSAPGNTLEGRLVLEIPQPESPSIYDERLQDQLRRYRTLPPDQTLRQAGVHDTAYELLRSFSGDPAYQAELATLFGAPRPAAQVENMAAPSSGAYNDDVATPAPLRIELPDRISTGGLLGVSLATEGSLRRFRRHQWRGHPVEIVAGNAPPPATPTPDTLLVKVTTFEVDPTSATMELAARLFRNQGKDDFYAACEQAAQAFACEVIRGPKQRARSRGSPGPYDLELVVNRMPTVSPAHASRRAVQFVTAVLDELDHPGVRRTAIAMQSYGATGDDLVEAQRTIDGLGIPGAVLTWIDLEGGVVELRFDAPGPPEDALYRIAAALGDETLGVYPRAEWSDPLAFRFGIARQRNHRRLDLDGSPEDRRAQLIVRGVDTDRPVIGHVAFYLTDEDERRIRRVRVRAADGVATCEVIRRARGYAVGAIIEDDGILLEQFVEPPTARTRKA